MVDALTALLVAQGLMVDSHSHTARGPAPAPVPAPASAPDQLNRTEGDKTAEKVLVEVIDAQGKMLQLAIWPDDADPLKAVRDFEFCTGAQYSATPDIRTWLQEPQKSRFGFNTHT